MYYDSETTLPRDQASLPFNPFKALIAPRPIGWVTTLAPDGTVNLAPYSYFQAVADSPDIVMFSATPQFSTTENGIAFRKERKDSEANATASGEFVCNLVSLDLAEAMNLTSAHHDSSVSEPEVAGIDMVPSERVAPPRVAAAPAALECIVVDSHPVKHRNGEHRYHLTFGEVVGIHINDAFIRDGRVDTVAMQLVTRMGYDEYAVLDKAFTMSRPDNDPVLDGYLKN